MVRAYWKRENTVNEDTQTVKAFEGTRDFESDKDANKFLERLAMFKMKLAFRGAHENFTKMSDGFKRKTFASGITFGSYDYKKPAVKAIEANTYKMSVSIEHLKQAA